MSIKIYYGYEGDIEGTYYPYPDPVLYDKKWTPYTFEFITIVEGDLKLGETYYIWENEIVSNEPAPQEGYTFMGWYSSETGGTKMPSNATAKEIGGGYWYTQWTKNIDPANIYFYNESGQDLSNTSLTLAYGSTITIYVKATYGDADTVISPNLIKMTNSSSGEIGCTTTVESANNRVKSCYRAR